VYGEGKITDTPQTLEEIREWVVNRLLRLKKVFNPRFKRLLK
jgi:hypothetical protein